MKSERMKSSLGKGLALLLALLLAATALADSQESHAGKAGATPLAIIATVFPAYDFAREIAGERATVRLLLPPGSESHSYEPTPQDILAIQNADLFVYVGGENEHWVGEILASMGEKAPTALAMLDCVATLEEEYSESMEDNHNDHASELDQHVWTSPKNAKRIVQALTQALTRQDSAGAALYAAREESYLAKLDELDAAFTEVVEGGVRRKIIFGDRFPFRYFANDYGLSYDAAFPGCSEESELSPQTLISLIREIRKEGIPVVFYIEFSSQKTAGILAEETGAKPLLMHSCHNVSAEEMDAGATYLSLMWDNAAALKEALQ